MLVIDACALIEILTVEPSEIPELNNRVRASEWMSAPALIDYEVLNVLRKMATRGDIDEYLAEESRLVLRNLRLNRVPLDDEMSERIWELRHNVSAYDASYVAVAEHLNVPLVTTERRLASGARKHTSIKIESYAI